MKNNSIKLSEKLLFRLLKEPGGFSFFPSPFFWYSGFLSNSILKSKLKKYFLTNDGLLNLYIHIPYCSRICSYCNCFKIYSNQDEHSKYIDYLEKEVIIYYELNGNKKIKIDSIFIGGGTPNILSVENIKKLYLIISKYFCFDDIDFLFDSHPNHMDRKKLDVLKEIGVSRITFAVQSLDKLVLEKNNRDSYDINHIEDMISYTKKIGIKLNIDLLIGLKGQTLESFKNDYSYFVGLGVDNISDHFMMNSNNISYKLDTNYSSLVSNAKKYIKDTSFKNTSQNIQESIYASKKSSTLSLGAYGVSNFFSNFTFQKGPINEYFLQLDNLELPLSKGKLYDLNFEKIKYIFLNILNGINTTYYKEIFSEDFGKSFKSEIDFLLNSNIIIENRGIILPNTNDKDLLTTFTHLFLLKKLEKKDIKLLIEDTEYCNFDLFFDESGTLIDK